MLWTLKNIFVDQLLTVCFLRGLSCAEVATGSSAAMDTAIATPGRPICYLTKCQRFESENKGQAIAQKRMKKAKNSDAYQRIAFLSQPGSLPTKRADEESVPFTG